MLLICTKYDHLMLCWVYTTDNMEYIILNNLGTYACDRWFKYIKYYIKYKFRLLYQYLRLLDALWCIYQLWHVIC